MKKLFGILLLSAISFTSAAFPKTYTAADAVKDLGGVVEKVEVDCGRSGAYHGWVKKEDIENFTQSSVNRVYQGVNSSFFFYFSFSHCTVTIEKD